MVPPQIYHYHYDSNRLAHLYDLKYQQGTATHLRIAQKQALPRDGLYTNQALKEMMMMSSDVNRAF